MTLDSSLQLPSVKNGNKTAVWSASGVLRGVLGAMQACPILRERGKRVIQREGPQEAMQSLGALPGVFSIPHLRTFLRGVLLEHPWDYP